MLLVTERETNGNGDQWAERRGVHEWRLKAAEKTLQELEKSQREFARHVEERLNKVERTQVEMTGELNELKDDIRQFAKDAEKGREEAVSKLKETLKEKEATTTRLVTNFIYPTLAAILATVMVYLLLKGGVALK